MVVEESVVKCVIVSSLVEYDVGESLSEYVAVKNQAVSTVVEYFVESIVEYVVELDETSIKIKYFTLEKKCLYKMVPYN